MSDRWLRPCILRLPPEVWNVVWSMHALCPIHDEAFAQLDLPVLAGVRVHPQVRPPVRMGPSGSMGGIPRE